MRAGSIDTQSALASSAEGARSSDARQRGPPAKGGQVTESKSLFGAPKCSNGQPSLLAPLFLSPHLKRGLPG